MIPNFNLNSQICLSTLLNKAYDKVYNEHINFMSLAIKTEIRVCAFSILKAMILIKNKHGEEPDYFLNINAISPAIHSFENFKIIELPVNFLKKFTADLINANETSNFVFNSSQDLTKYLKILKTFKIVLLYLLNNQDNFVDNEEELNQLNNVKEIFQYLIQNYYSFNNHNFDKININNPITEKLDQILQYNNLYQEFKNRDALFYYMFFSSKLPKISSCNSPSITYFYNFPVKNDNPKSIISTFLLPPKLLFMQSNFNKPSLFMTKPIDYYLEQIEESIFKLKMKH